MLQYSVYYFQWTVRACFAFRAFRRLSVYIIAIVVIGDLSRDELNAEHVRPPCPECRGSLTSDDPPSRLVALCYDCQSRRIELRRPDGAGRLVFRTKYMNKYICIQVDTRVCACVWLRPKAIAVRADVRYTPAACLSLTTGKHLININIKTMHLL